MPANWEDGKRIARAAEVITGELPDELALLDGKKGVYYGLGGVGATVWSFLDRPRTVGAILARVLEEYEVEPERCRRDLEALLESLEERGLIEVGQEG